MKVAPRSWATAAAAVAVATGGMLVLVLDGQAPAAPTQGPTAYQRQLQAKVQGPDGAPLAGRDPAAQAQTTLAQAAGRPQVKPATGRGVRVTSPRRASDVLGDPKKTGVLSSGCAVGYGTAGQCVPARAPGAGATTCRTVLPAFPRGIRVTGRDTLHLDTDRDGLACGDGDRGVPADAHAGHDMSGMQMP